MSSRRSLAFSLSALLVFLFALVSPSLLAAPADDLLRLHQLRLATQKSLGDFYMYNGMEGDQRYARMIGESLQEAQGHLDALGEMPGAGSKALRSQWQGEWQGYRDGLQALMEAMRSQGYTDLQPVADLADNNQRLMAIAQELYQKIQQESGHSVAPASSAAARSAPSTSWSASSPASSTDSVAPSRTPRRSVPHWAVSAPNGAISRNLC
jgi:hypothetical protein